MSGEAKSKKAAVATAAVLAAVLIGASVAYAVVGGSEGARGMTGAAWEHVGQAEPGTDGAQAASTWNNPAMYSLTMTDYEGEPVTFGAFADGQVTVVNIWATWCPYCIDEMQDYQELYDRYGDEVQFVMLDYAPDDGEVQAAASYVEEHGFTFPVYFDTQGEMGDYFKVYAYPTTVVIGADGEVLNNAPGRINKQGMSEALAGLV